MAMFTSRRLLKAAAIGTIGLGTLASLRVNEYDIGAIGIVRLSRAALTVFDIGRHYKKELFNSGLNKTSVEYLELKSNVHKYGAQKLLELCCANKGVYIKVGQHIGAMDYLLPKEYVQTMKILHSSAPQSSFKDVLTVIREDFKRDPYEIFQSIDREPLGTASLAQVHRAVLKNGDVVAVKVQHRAVKSNSYVDIKTMSALVSITSLVFPDFKFNWLVRETKKNIPRELDFILEGENTEKAQKLFNNYSWLRVPKIYWDVSSSRVLTMEFLEGGQIDDLQYIRAHHLNPYEISSKIGRLYSHMIFIEGFVHSDPHPGNILVRNRNSQAEIVLLDHGLYADLSDQFRWNYSKLWLAILDADRVAMKEYCTRLGVGDLYGLLACMVSGRTWETIVSGVRKTRYDAHEKEMFQQNVPNLLPQISVVLDRVNQQMLLILKTNDLMRGIEYSLRTQSRMSSMIEMSACCVRSVYGEKLRQCSSTWDRCRVLLAERWSLLKLSVYYTYLGLINFDLNRSVESLWTKDFYLE
ncbi:aarF domain-containing kinase 1 [Solenopsis invicta]|uniref:aarF domain-containing kinase 1 n=1 Tax=Solenopsis invicta TaxID=13686 RepID=UPI000595E1EB|nr:aarF domain-containing kinase 1 [Solenopsis invicta]XP_011172281.1 aarF domain-containing kinase 1 [Solenopsis invicta]